MSLFSWFYRKGQSKAVGQPLAASGGTTVRAAAPGGQFPARSDGGRLEPAAVLKVERTERREWVYSVVREAMLHAGVLSASYKFKVLALDERGRRFLVMVDLAKELAGDTAQLLRVEHQIAQTAKARYDLDISAVYWRTNEQIAAGRPRAAMAEGVTVAAPTAAPARQPPIARAPASSSRPAPLTASAPSPPLSSRPPAKPGGRFEPIQPDEVAAFKRALSAAVQTPTAPPPGEVLRSGPRAKAARGYEDTEMIEPPDRPDALSNTQYGDLK